MENSAVQIILKILDRALRSGSVRAYIDSCSLRIKQKLSSGSEDLLAWESVPLSIFRVKLPAVIRSSWVFVIRADSNTGAERHPNSYQFMMSYEGQGDLQVKKGNRWKSNGLVSDLNRELGKRWVSIPPKTWHRAVTRESTWTVVSFHTASADELLEERPKTGDKSIHERRYYKGSRN